MPSGIYSDAWSQPLRVLFLNHSRWEWLFGIENRDGVFPIHRSFKFNPIIVEKGGITETIRTAFMCRTVEDWERAEAIATPYRLDQINSFSPKSRAILEIRSKDDLEILEKIYSNAVLLGDDSPDGWGIKYKLEFMMNTDARLFPPRPQWEAQGYRPDEYSRWLKGDWRPIEALWEELNIDPSRPIPAEIELEDWLFDASAGPERREAEARFVHGHLLKPGDVARTEWRLRCAQQPYDRLPIPRAKIPEGVVLSREGDMWIREEDMEDVALPLYEGRMIGQFDFSQKGWVRGKGRTAVWRDIPWHEKKIEPQYLMAADVYNEAVPRPYEAKLLHMNIGSATNERTAIGALASGGPTGHSAGVFYLSNVEEVAALTVIFNSFAFDYLTRQRVVGLHLDYHVLEQNALPVPFRWTKQLAEVGAGLVLASPQHSLHLIGLAKDRRDFARPMALTQFERIRHLALLNAVVARLYELDQEDVFQILGGCDLPSTDLAKARSKSGSLDPKGFWRIDGDKSPELRHTVLAQIAFQDLEDKIIAVGDRDQGIEAFLAQNRGEGWMLPETLRLADYDLGHDDRAQQFQPVASRLGPRFYDWQLVQTAEESWRECHLHARNLLGADGYARLLSGADEEPKESLPLVAEPRASYGSKEEPIQQSLFAPGSAASRDNKKDKPS